jgi:hypothetical protein
MPPPQRSDRREAEHDIGVRRPGPRPPLVKPMTDPGDNPALIRAALLRKALADARQRAALARRLGFTHNEVLALQ